MKLMSLVRQVMGHARWLTGWRASMVFLGILAGLAAPAWSQSGGAATTVAPPINVDVTLNRARAQIDRVQRGLRGAVGDAELVELRADAQDAQTQAEAAVAQLDPQLAGVKARLAELGPPPVGAPEAADVAAQRAQLIRSSGRLDSQTKLARLISVEAGQAMEQIQTSRRSQFQARLGERTDSVLGRRFWSGLVTEWPRDSRRVAPLAAEASRLFLAIPGQVVAGLSFVILVIIALRLAVGRTLRRLTTTRVPRGRLRRSLYAVAQVLLAVAVPGLIAWLLRVGLSWPGDLSDTMDELLGRMVGLVLFGGVVAGLGHALLAAERPSWRLPKVDDATARGLRWHPLIVAVIIVVGLLAQHLAADVNAGLSVTVVLDCTNGLLIGLVLANGLARVRKLHRAALRDVENHGLPVRPLWLVALLSLAWVTLAFSVTSILVGYVALGSFLARQVVWVATVLSSTYLLTVLIGDGCNSLLAVTKRAGEAGGSPALLGARCQALVLLSGLGRLVVILFALMLLAIPLGEGPSEWIARFQQLYTGISIGEARIRPTAVLLAVLLLVFGFAGLKILRQWLLDSYLPTTGMDSGMRTSSATLFGYAGYVLVVALSLSVAGIGLERVAWIASALSVGIGFGLQAVVQNFVSGLILLAERPVKVGDWVSLDDVEGDIRRISVRATEIQMWDRSTVVVPNSEFITKVVRNVTRANPMGRVQIRVPMPVATDPDQARDLILGAFCEHSGVLDEPAPSVLLDGIDASGLLFIATGYVGSPRLAASVRSDLLFDILKRLREAGLALSSPTTMLLAQSSPPAPTAVAAAPLAPE